jgi:hypothetical protein
MLYRYRLKKDIGVSHLFVEKDGITLTREWHPSQQPLLETQLKNLIEAQWSNTSDFQEVHDLWTDPPQGEQETNVLVEVSTELPPEQRDAAVKEAMDRFFKPKTKTVSTLREVEEELPE